ncbi:hypothetical protein EON65_47740 [archaeon]|nr:MAG: hypothetical protein EON65_47740 [archaeon]
MFTLVSSFTLYMLHWNITFIVLATILTSTPPVKFIIIFTPCQSQPCGQIRPTLRTLLLRRRQFQFR